jgi:VIT1/CCC1 family predicted Fe2+/Mn2+ transporter
LRAHVEAELQINPDELTNPWDAAGASFLAFAVGGLVPTLAILVPVGGWRVAVCVAAVIVGLVVTGDLSARLGSAPPKPAVLRNVAVGILTMAITYLAGKVTGGLVG